MWIEYGKNNNGMWVNPEHVSVIRNIGKGGSRGSILTLNNGHSFLTGYPATQLQALLFEGNNGRR